MMLFDFTLVLGFLFLANTATAFDYGLNSEPDEEPTLSLTDTETGIADIKTLFIGEPTAVTVNGLSWIPIEDGVESNASAIIWTTLVDGNVVATGNVSLVGLGRALPTTVEAGSFIVTNNQEHTIEVVLKVDTTEVTVSTPIVAYRPGVSLFPLIVVLLLALTTHMVRFFIHILLLAAIEMFDPFSYGASVQTLISFLCLR
jgi:hypothetical protein